MVDKTTRKARVMLIAAGLLTAVLVLAAWGTASAQRAEPANVAFSESLPADFHLEAERGSSGLPDGMLISRALALGLPVVLVPFSEACAGCLNQLRVADALATAFAVRVR